MEVDDVGEVSADCIFRFFHDEKNRAMINRLKSLGVNMEAEETETIDSAVSGKTVVITGTLPTLGRKEAAELVEKYGGELSFRQEGEIVSLYLLLPCRTAEK